MAHLLFHQFGTDAIPPAATGGAVAIGNFDGVHLGHRALIDQLNAQAERIRGPAVVVTFDPPPIAVLRPDLLLPRPLTTLQRRTELLGGLGVDFVVSLQTDASLLSKSASVFFDELVVSKLAAKAIVEGPNFRFGRDREGDGVLLRKLTQESDMALTILEARSQGSEMISSTRIRQALQTGDVAAANAMLAEGYQIEGRVHAGEKRGRELGFPTANLTQLPMLLPDSGVFAGVTTIGGIEYACAIHIGPNPTFAEDIAKVEVHVIGWTGDLYGRQLACQLLAKLRDVERFDSVEALRRQIHTDVEACRKYLASSQT